MGVGGGGGVGARGPKWAEHKRRERAGCWLVNSLEHRIKCLHSKCHLPVRCCSAITRHDDGAGSPVTSSTSAQTQDQKHFPWILFHVLFAAAGYKPVS